MYSSLKKIAKSIVPISLLKKNESFFRYVVSLSYRGNRYQCNICLTKLRKFVPLPSGDQLCPNCGSRSRGRRLYSFLNEHQLIKGSILHFSPPKCLYKQIKKAISNSYYATDFENEFVADYHFDITQIDLPDNSIDLIICYHVLEHIENDIRAMSELYRVLKQGGKTLIQTPFKEGAIYEDASITSEEARTIAFGQKDHVRVYSKTGLAERLKSIGFQTSIENFIEEKAHYNGLRSETIIVASI